MKRCYTSFLIIKKMVIFYCKWMQATIKKVRSPTSPGVNKKHSCNDCKCNGVEISEGTNLNVVMIADVDTFLLCTILFF